jgi:SEC-C motif-containing protein
MRTSDVFDRPCPCGTTAGYRACCGPLHHGERQAVTAEELMRSRYAAYVVADADYLFRTWHPRTRPAEVRSDADVVWTGLEVTDTLAGGPGDGRGDVEFTASFIGGEMQRGGPRRRPRGRRVHGVLHRG